jgi:hypothetical protein
MTRTCNPYLVIAALLVATGGAQAAEQIEISFDFAMSTTVSAYGGQVQVPPQGIINSGSVSLTIPGAGPIYALPGPSVLENAELDVSIDALSLGANILGILLASQAGTTSGSLAVGLDEITLTGPLMMDTSGNLDCGGNAQMCSMLGSFALVVDGIETIPAGNVLTLRDVNVAGQAELEGSLVLSISGPSSETVVVIHLLGKETNRSYLPEPTGPISLAIGAAALWLLSKRRDHRRGVRPP